MAKENRLLIISGATATGKTDLSILIAKRFSDHKFEIINFDSLLFYKEINIGTAKPSQEELESIPHHLINIGSIKNEVNASDFVKMALEKINELHAVGIIPILVGGSTFYLRSLIKGMYQSAPVSQKLREEVESLIQQEGITPIITFLKENDPQSLIDLHENDHYRLARAYEHFKTTGTPISKEKKKFDESNPYDFSNNDHNWNILHLSLEVPKDQHWEIMEKRVHKMISAGLINEVEDLLKMDYTGQEKPLQSIGYKETIDFINKETLKSEEELVERIYLNTRRLAKSQKTFLKKVNPKQSFNILTDKDLALQAVKDFLRII